MIIITHKYLGDSYTAKSHYMGAVKFGAKLDRGTKCCKTHLNPKHLWVQCSSTHSSARLVVDRYVPMRQRATALVCTLPRVKYWRSNPIPLTLRLYPAALHASVAVLHATPT